MTIATFTLESATTQANAPFSLGHAFKKGDVPSGSQLVGSIAELQVASKNAWPDGSLKFAVVSGRAALTASTPLSVVLSIGTPAAGTALTIADLKATGVVASVGCGAFGTASWATTDWDSPFEMWVSGPRSSTWRYRKPVGSDAHLVAWLEVTIFAGGEVEVLPWIENGYCRVAAPANKSETYTFTLGGTQRCSVAVNLMHHQRTPIINGTALSYWLGTDPGVTPAIDTAYLQATELVPSYSAVVSPTGPEATRISGVAYTSYTPLQKTGFEYDSDYMPSSGYQRPIGLLPTVDVMYLATSVANSYGAVVRNGFSAGRYHSHFRDESTNKPILFSAFPNFTLQGSQGFGSSGGSTTGDVAPTITGGSLASWDTAHSPLVGYMAYLLTGRKYFAEETQFAANFDYIGQGDNSALRVGAQGLMRPEVGAWQTRAAAWQWRTRSAALTITPDSDTALRAEYARTIENTIVSFHNKYIVQTNNPWGIFEPGGMYDSDNYRTVAAWMEDFYTASIGWSLCQELPISATHKAKLIDLFQWKAKSVVLRLGTSDKFWYVNPMPYQLAISPPSATLIDYKTGVGPWLPTEAAIYDGTYNPLRPAYQGGHFSTTEGTLQGEYDPSVWVISMLGNMMPAISYAVRHGAPGAAEGYARLTGATNWPTVAANFNLKPVWSVEPLFAGTSIVTTPGPKMRVGQLLAGKMAVSGFRGLGITSAQNATGFAKPSLLEQHMVGADPTSEFLWVADDVPAGLGLTIYEDSSAAVSGADGVYNGNKTVYTDGAGSAGTYSFTLGVVSIITGVSISPTTATGAVTFTATVSGTGSFSTAKTFSKISGGGSIDASTGTFTPPAQTGSVQTIVVRATSTQDPTWHAEATITIAAGTPTVTGVTVTPSTAAMAEGGTQDFNATVSGAFSPSQGVNWATDLGNIDAAGGLSGLVGIAGTIQNGTVTATSQLNGTKSGTATFTIAALVSRAPRFARPDADITVGTWVPSSGPSLFATLDEVTADSTDYSSTTSASTAVVSLNPVVDPGTSVNQVVRYQAWAPTGGTLTVRLKQGSTVIASWSHSTLPTTPTIFAQSLTGPECDSITDYTLLRFEFVATP